MKGSLRLRAITALLLSMLLWHVAAARQLDAAEAIAVDLGPNEGLVAVVIEDSAGTSSVHLDGSDGGSNTFIKKLGLGRNFRLLQLPAGNYRWSMANLPSKISSDSHLDVPKEPAFQFRVEPGVINYAGDLVVAGLGNGWIRCRNIDRELLAMIAMDKQFPGVRKRFAWRGAMGMPDPFATFANDKIGERNLLDLAAAADADAASALKIPIDEKLGNLVEELFASPSIVGVHLHPSGKFLAFEDVIGAEIQIKVTDLSTGQTQTVLKSLRKVTYLAWGGEHNLLVSLGDLRRLPTNSIEQMFGVITDAELSKADPGAGSFSLQLAGDSAAAEPVRRLRIPGLGWFVSALPDDPQYCLFAHYDGEQVRVFRIDKTAKAFDPRQFRIDVSLSKGLEGPRHVIADSHGELQAAVVREGNGSAVLVRDPDHSGWRRLMGFAAAEQFELIALDQDPSNFLVLTNIGRAQVELVKLSRATGKLGDTVLAQPGSDLISVIQSGKGNVVIGARYYAGSLPGVRYLDRGQDQRVVEIAKRFPAANVLLWEESDDALRSLVFVYSETDRGKYYLYEPAQHRLEELFASNPPYVHAKPVTSTRFTVRSKDGAEIEALLSIPPTAAAGSSRLPLLVTPHGGPLRSGDRQIFDPEVQLLVARGYAVLRVNYRGSGGAGRAFEEAGFLNWGRGIGDDIEAAVREALQRAPLDPSRIALVGVDYGGYASLMELIRAPDLFRCAVAISAVTDLPLLFNSSDWSTNASLVELMKTVVGDPVTQMERLQEVSPSYQFERLQRPVLLVHGTADTRVTFEHALRLRMLMNSGPYKAEWLPLAGAGHTLTTMPQILVVYAATDNFLSRCLAPAVAGNPGKLAPSGL